MKPGARVAAFVALLAVIFGGAALAGGALDPEGDGADHAPTVGEGGATHATSHDAAAEGGAHGAEGSAAAEGGGAHGAEGSATADGDGAHGAEGAATAEGGGAHGAEGSATAGAATPAGVSSAQHGYRLVADRTRFAPGKVAPLRFRILDADGATVRDFQTEQARRMHVIVVRRDLRRYQHLHPSQGRDGAWTASLTVPDAGVYRAFADFRRGGEQHTLGVDLFAPGTFAPLDLPAPSTTARVDGYEVKLHEHAGELGFFVRRGGNLVTDLQPYLGARGHLVALREGDLAYQHIHPESKPPPEIAFHTGAQQAGSYRLFLQFRHGDRVHTAAFTRTVRP